MADREKWTRHALRRGNEAHAAFNLMCRELFCNRPELWHPIYFSADVDVCASRRLMCGSTMPTEGLCIFCFRELASEFK